MDPADIGPIAVAEFDVAPVADAAAELMPCCASRRWISGLVSGRPYARLDRLTAASDALLARLDWPELESALAGHPRIGDRASGAGRSDGWSRQEQAGTATAADLVRQELAAANVAYERRFGHVFLICATGLSAETMLNALLSRLANDPIAEREVVRSELAKIVRLRLAKAFR
ncbi:2-oxo-4-hydroxy-4-carboxy-5-ureidoimidazoline decarboxylase [Jatrophihabitans sp.]|uniref:2-oxo-4-hydroxy-4-carboxy-5-ureidoimidazoline decarboxylase n=1 Tax=Jatrophihabitans sp. TaxID=1932789 RepID=UPI002F14A0E1